MNDMIFPINAGQVAWSTKVEQKWDVSEYVSASGKRKTITHQTLPQWTFNLEFPSLDKHDVDKLSAFYAHCRGPWKSFLYKDYENYSVVNKTLEKGTDGLYQAVIPIDGYEENAESIDNVRVYVDGVPIDDFTVEDGKIRVNASGRITFDYEYYWRVYFKGSLSITQKFLDMYKVSLTLCVER